MAAEENQPPRSQRSPGHLEQEETRLWRVVLWFLVLLAAALAALMWERLQSVPYHLGAIAPGLLLPSYGQTQREFEASASRNPMGRPIDLDDVASALEFLLGNASLTGQVIQTDNGQRYVGSARDVMTLSA